MNINNIPEYAKNRAFMVCNEIDGELWFWGAYDDRNKANEAAMDIGGVVIPSK